MPDYKFVSPEDARVGDIVKFSPDIPHGETVSRRYGQETRYWTWRTKSGKILEIDPGPPIMAKMGELKWIKLSDPGYKIMREVDAQ